MIRRFALISFFSTLALPAAPKSGGPALPLGAREVLFEENRGQVEGGVNFLARLSGQHFYASRAAVVFAPWGAQPVRLAFAGANANARWEPVGDVRDTISYHVGRDASRWVDRAPLYARIALKDVYPGVDAIFYGAGGGLEYDLVVAPGADPSRIHLKWSGAKRVTVDAAGTMDVFTGAETIRQRLPAIYQQTSAGRRRVAGRFVRAPGGEFRLALEKYDRALPLVVDPVIEMASYFGGEGDDEVSAVGQIYMAGTTRSVSLPPTGRTPRPSRDIFLRGIGGVYRGGGFAPSLGLVIMGGSGDDELLASHVRELGSTAIISLAGATASIDFAGDSNPPADPGYAGGASDGFVATVQFSLGPQLFPRYSGVRYIGGAGDDRVTGVVSDNVGTLVVGTTTSRDLPGAVGQSSYAGGLDGFIALLNTSQVLYFGGSGDDKIMTAAPGPFAATYWFGGETSSEDLPHQVNGTAGRKGATDAFLGRITLTFNADLRQYTLSGIESILLGGSGEDRIQALSSVAEVPGQAFSNFLVRNPTLGQLYGLVVAGSTTSPDLPVANAAQPANAGGWDGFVGVWSPARNRFDWLTYLGGSGYDEALSVAQNWAGEVFLGGSTESSDLRTVDPLKGAPGGARDGLFALYDRAGRPVQVSYYGGSGDDRILGVTVTQDNHARVVGVTRSSDLPDVRSLQQGANQGAEGFMAEIGTAYVAGPEEIAMGKDGARAVSFRGGRAARQSFTYRSLNPSLVRFAYLGNSVEQFSASAEEHVVIEALADSGEALIEITADGHPPKTVRVRLYPSVLSPLISSQRLSLWATLNLGLGWALYPVDPSTGQRLGPSMAVRTGLKAPDVRWRSSDANVFEVTQEFSLSFGASVATVRPRGPGQAVLSVEADGFQADNSTPVVITVERPEFQTRDFKMGRDTQSSVPYSFVLPGIAILGGRGTVTARSEDPSRLLLSKDPNIPGQAEVTVSPEINRLTPIYAQALAGEGTVGVILTSSETAEERICTVTLEPPVLRWGLSTQSLGRDSAELPLRRSSELVFQSDFRRPGAPPVSARLTNSEPTVIELNRLTVPLFRDSSVFPRAEVFARAAGTSSLSLTVTPADIRVENPVIRVAAVPETVALEVTQRLVHLGKQLQYPVRVRHTPGLPLTITSADPSKLLISASHTQAGVAQLTIDPAGGSSDRDIFLQGSGEEGETTVLVRAPGARDIVLRVVHLRSGLALARSGSTLSVVACPLDPGTAIPLNQQTLRPGITVQARLRVEGTSVRVSPEQVTLSAADSAPRATITEVTAGERSVIVLEPADGFSKPAMDDRLEIVPRGVALTSLGSAVYAVAEGTVGVVSFSVNTPQEVTVTATSDSPGLLLLSTRPEQEGAAQITWNARQSTSIYLHGVAAGGQATVRLEAQGREPVTFTALVTAMRTQLIGPNQLLPGSTVNLSLQIGSSFPGVSANLVAARPGATPLRFTLRASDPQVIRLTPTELTFGPGLNQVTAALEGLTPGESDLILDGPGDANIANRVTRITVLQPSVLSSGAIYSLGKNLQGSIAIRMNAGSPNGAIATITSSDPSRLVVSRTASALGSGSASVAVPPGAGGTNPVFLQALEGSGEVAVDVTIPGFRPAQFRVRLTRSWFGLGAGLGGNQIVRFPAGGVTQVYTPLRFDPPPISQGETVLGLEGIQLRPGLGELRLPVEVRDSGILSVDPPAFVLGDGVANFTPLTLRGLVPGTTLLSIGQPPGFGPAGPSEAQLPVEVAMPSLPVSCGGPIVGYGALASCFVERREGLGQITATSTDPAKLTLSNDQRTVGAASMAVTSGSMVYFHGLASAGTVEVVLSAAGYEDYRIPVRLRPSEIGFEQATMVVGLNRTAQIQISLRADTGSFSGPRPGLSVSLRPSASPAGVISIDPPSADFPSTSTFTLRGVASGATVLRLETPPGFAESARGALGVRVEP